MTTTIEKLREMLDDGLCLKKSDGRVYWCCENSKGRILVCPVKAEPYDTSIIVRQISDAEFLENFSPLPPDSKKILVLALLEGRISPPEVLTVAKRIKRR